MIYSCGKLVPCRKFGFRTEILLNPVRILYILFRRFVICYFMKYSFTELGLEKTFHFSTICCCGFRTVCWNGTFPVGTMQIKFQLVSVGFL